MDDRAHILNLRDNVQQYINKNKLCIIIFFSNYEINNKHIIERSYLIIKNCVIGISKITYIQAGKTEDHPVLWVFYICIRLCMQVSYV